jgi:hypothetical protein|tara:strand:+ start:350 stop:484 length:135 start_codon:yes stop_codon:yes gene_type:complete
MISPSGDLRVYVATRPIDFRNYVATVIMRSRVCRFVADAIFTVG